MNKKLDKLTIKGFKSIRALENIELNNLNVIVGANGAGKSNFISFFRLLKAFIDGDLKRFVMNQGGISDLLFNGLKATDKMFFETQSGCLTHRFCIVPTPNNSYIIENQSISLDKCRQESSFINLSENHRPPFVGNSNNYTYNEYLDALRFLTDDESFDYLKSIKSYHFHDTSSTSKMRGYEIIQDYKYLRNDAANIAPFLRHLKLNHLKHYQQIVNTIRLVAPFIDDFILEPQSFGESEKVNLSWHKQDSDYPMQPYHLSDGTLRFICLATALLQPEPPQTIIIDAPELGLHPAAIMILAELIQSASQRMQVIVATQSPLLLDQFAINDIIVVRNKNGESLFERLSEEDYHYWLEEYSIGELWVKNVITGGPQYG